MVCGPVNKFNRIKHFGQSNVINRLEENLKAFYDWGFLCIGGFTNVPSGTLISVPCCPGQPEGLVYQGMRKNWIWQDISYSGVDGTVYTTNTPPTINGADVSGIDYTNGQVILNSAPAGDVTASYSFRNVQIYVANDAPWWLELQYLTWNVDDSHFNRCDDGTGDWVIGAHHRVQMPAIVIYATNDGGLSPNCIGGCYVKREQNVFLNVFAETKCIRDDLIDIIVAQDEKKILLYNPDDVYLAGDYPLDCNGYLVGNKTYPELVDEYEWACTRIENTNVVGLNSLRCGLHEGTVKIKTSTTFSSL